MEFKVDPGELLNVEEIMKKDAEMYDTEIEKMLKQVEILRTIWVGDPATIFCDNFQDYLEKMKNIPIAMRNMAKVIDTSTTGYTDIDETFAREMEKEMQQYEQLPTNY